MPDSPFEDLKNREVNYSNPIEFKKSHGEKDDFNTSKARQQADAVLLTIKASFISAIVITIFRFLLTKPADLGQFVSDISTIWNIFIPVITLAIGYMFGKNGSEK